jgi:putative membrane protein
MIPGMMHGYGYGGFGWIGLIFNLVITIGILVGIILLVVWVVRQISPSAKKRSSGVGTIPSAVETLKVRYAKGEISREEYQQILRDIS